jgi:hypothetical protein
MVSERGFDYSWDDQDPDQMTDLVSGEYGASPDIEDHQPSGGSHNCSCESEFSSECEYCGHSLNCCRESGVIHDSNDEDEIDCPCKKELVDVCGMCEHSFDCEDTDCDSPDHLNKNNLIPSSNYDTGAIRLTPSQSLVEALDQLRLLKLKIRQMEEEEQALRDMIVEATGDRASILVDPKDPTKVLATVLKKPFSWMKAGGQATLKKDYPKLYEQLFTTRTVTRLLLKDKPTT